jgi:hypothetical protein
MANPGYFKNDFAALWKVVDIRSMNLPFLALPLYCDTFNIAAAFILWNSRKKNDLLCGF